MDLDTLRARRAQLEAEARRIELEEARLAEEAAEARRDAERTEAERAAHVEGQRLDQVVDAALVAGIKALDAAHAAAVTIARAHEQASYGPRPRPPLDRHSNTFLQSDDLERWLADLERHQPEAFRRAKAATQQDRRARWQATV